MTPSKKQTHLPASKAPEPMWEDDLGKLPSDVSVQEYKLLNADQAVAFLTNPPGHVHTVPQTWGAGVIVAEEEKIGDWAGDDRSEALPDSVDRTVAACYDAAHELGWHKSWEGLIRAVHNGKALEDMYPRTEEDVNNWISSKLLLVVSEIVEAQEELRNGRDRNEIYYRDVNGYYIDQPIDACYDEQVYLDGIPMLKPEGFLVEVADAYIRICDLVGVTAQDSEISFGEVVESKLLYNATRGAMHGGKKF